MCLSKTLLSLSVCLQLQLAYTITFVSACISKTMRLVISDKGLASSSELVLCTMHRFLALYYIYTSGSPDMGIQQGTRALIDQL